MWKANVNKDGYGTIYFDGKIVLAHRLMYLMIFGNIAKGYLVRHSCGNRGCCKPEHLLLGTHKDNNQDTLDQKRNYWANRTHCKNGHEYKEGSHWIERGKIRRCKACDQGRKEKMILKKKEQRKSGARG